MEKQEFKRTVEFIDSKGSLAKVKIEIDYDNGYKEFSMCGDYENHGGQCDDSIKPANDNQKALLELWDKYHLNGMNAGTATQEKALEKSDCDVSDYDKRKKYLKKINLYEVTYRGKSYKYGSGWIKLYLPKNIIDMVNTICDNIEADNKQRIESIERYYCTDCNEVKYAEDVKLFGECPDCENKELKKIDTWEDIETMEKNGTVVFDDDKIMALGKYLDLTPSETLEDIEASSCKYSTNVYTYAGQDYLICDDDEADEAANDYLKDDPEMWKMAVEADNTTQGLDDWAEDVINMDGRGSILNSYDGNEGEEKINGTYYFIYRR